VTNSVPITRKYLRVLVALAIVLSLPVVNPPSASAQAAGTFLPTDDSYVDDSRADRNYGNRPSIRVDGSPTRTGFMKFTVSGIGTTDSASVRIFMGSTGDDVSIYQVADTTWTEGTITAATAPPVGALIATVSPVQSGGSYLFDVSSVVTGDGTYSFALRTTDNTALKIRSSESDLPPQLVVPSPAPISSFVITRDLTTYTATPAPAGDSHVGTAKAVIEAAVADLMVSGGGTVTFGADTYDFGTDHLELNSVANITFEGQGMSLTTLMNNSSESTDTEIFDIVGGDGLVVRDMTIAAGGPFRSTSDALDFDDGNNILIQNIRIVESRGRGIVFDGKGDGWTANNNTISGCEINGIPGDGIELLASSNNAISDCTITNVGGHGIQINKSSTSAVQPNKQSNNNTISNVTIDQAGQDGININSGDGNVITAATITNSADDTASKDGIRIFSSNAIACNANEIHGSLVTDNQTTKTQRYGLNISSSICSNNIIGLGNDFSGNKTADINDIGTNTQYPDDTQAPTVPTGVTATASSPFNVNVGWTASTDNVGVASYTIYRDGLSIGSVSGATLSYADSTVAPLTTYTYTVEAFDAATNASGQSAGVLVTTPDVAANFTVLPSADAFVHSGNPTRNYGSSSQLRVDASPTVVSYLRFDVTGIVDPVTSVTLRVYANSSSSGGVNISEVLDASWTESGITYDTAPAVGTLLGSEPPFSGGAYIEIDLTAHVTADGTYVLAITGISNTAISMSSREGANAPELVIATAP